MKSRRGFRLGQMTLLAAAVFSFTPALFAAAPVVSNVRSTQRAGTKLVDIYYNLSASGAPVVSVTVSTDGGATYTLVPTSLTGAVGTVTPGNDRHIEWNAGLDWPNQVSSQMRVKVTANDSTPGSMALIPAGSFTMGNSMDPAEGYSDELPLHPVYVSAFYMDKYEVTNDKMVEVMQWAYQQGKISVTSATVINLEGNQQELLDLDSPYCRISWNGAQFQMKASKGPGYPCVAVTWYGAVAFCEYRSLKEGRTPCYNLSDWSCNWAANGYRLPTEAEWEKAARGGASGHRFPWSDTDTIQHSRANYYAYPPPFGYAYDVNPTEGYHPTFDTGDSPYTSTVGYFAANGYGLYDMAGNVMEWCWDWYSAGWYSDAGATQSDTRGPASSSHRLRRGGAGEFPAYDSRCAGRRHAPPSFASRYFGFRCVRGL